MSINHYIDPNIEPKLDLYAKSITVNGTKIDGFKQYVTDLIEVTSPAYLQNINLRKSVVEITPIRENYDFQGFNKNYITIKISGTLDIVNLPLIPPTTTKLVVDWTNFNNTVPENLIMSALRYCDASIDTRQGTIMSGDVFTQQLPLRVVNTNIISEATFEFDRVTTGADSGDYSSLPNNPFELTLQFSTLFVENP